MWLMDQSSISSDFHFFTLALLREVVREGIHVSLFFDQGQTQFQAYV